LGDSKLLWPGVAAVCEGLCGNCVNGVELIRCDQLKNKSSRRVTYGNPWYSIGSKADSIYFLNSRRIFVWHFISVHLICLIQLHFDLTTLKIARLWTVKEMSPLPYPHGCRMNFRAWLPCLAAIILNHNMYFVQREIGRF
jgi:hypothetical protein